MRKQRKGSIAVIGCGKLGSPLIGCLADAGYQVVGVDSNSELIENLSSGRVPWNEPGLDHLLSKNRKKITFKETGNTDFSKFLATFIIVPTPSLPNGAFSNEFVNSAVRLVGESFRNSRESEHIIVIVSTVMPGSTSGEITSNLDDSIGTDRHNVRLCYSPEFIALGSVIKNMRYPDIVLIGESDSKSGKLLESISTSIVKNHPKVHHMSTSEAEVAKISINAFVTTKISFSNQISEICQALPGSSADKVLKAIGEDSRIGGSYLKAAPGFGGPCFPRDNRAFAVFSELAAAPAVIAKATDIVNQRQGSRLINLAVRKIPLNGRLVLVGASYKPGTSVIEESPSIEFAELASRQGFEVSFVDNLVKHLPSQYDYQVYNSAESGEIIFRADAVFLFVSASEYLEIPSRCNSNAFLFDLWGDWNKFENEFGKRYVRLGKYNE